MIKKVNTPCWIAFAAAFVIGLLDYLYIITNKFLTYDSMWNIYSAQDMITSGRQFLKYACSISSYYDLPAVNGILAIFYLSVTAALLVYIFDIKGYIGSALVGGIIVSFPAVSSAFCYTYTVDGYMLAVLIMTVVFVLMDKYRFGWIPAIFLIGFSIGIYQAYYSYIIILCVLKLLLYLIYEDSLKKIIGKAARYLTAGIGGYIFYVISLKLMLEHKGVALSGYQGSDRVLGFDVSTVPLNCYKAFRNFFSFIFSMNVLTATEAMRIGLALVFVVSALSFVWLLITRKVYRSISRVLFMLILIVATPVLATLAAVMAPDGYFHVLMREPWALFFVFSICVVELAAKELETGHEDIFKRVGMLSCGVCTLATVLLIQQFAVMQGIVAFNMNERYEKTYFVCQSVIERLCSNEDYAYGDEVAIIGSIPNPEMFPPTSITDRYVGWYFGVNGELCVSTTSEYEAFSAHYLGVEFYVADDETVSEIVSSDEYCDMPCYPASGYIRKVDGVWVVKLNG